MLLQNSNVPWNWSEADPWKRFERPNEFGLNCQCRCYSIQFDNATAEFKCSGYACTRQCTTNCINKLYHKFVPKESTKSCTKICTLICALNLVGVHTYLPGLVFWLWSFMAIMLTLCLGEIQLDFVAGLRCGNFDL